MERAGGSVGGAVVDASAWLSATGIAPGAGRVQSGGAAASAGVQASADQDYQGTHRDLRCGRSHDGRQVCERRTPIEVSIANPDPRHVKRGKWASQDDRRRRLKRAAQNREPALTSWSGKNDRNSRLASAKKASAEPSVWPDHSDHSEAASNFACAPLSVCGGFSSMLARHCPQATLSSRSALPPSEGSS